MKIIKIIILTFISTQVLFSQSQPTVAASDYIQKLILSNKSEDLNIPFRPEGAISGSKFVNQVAGLNLEDREVAIAKEILTGNVPSFSRKLRPLTISRKIDEIDYELTFFTVCDYMAVGSDQDYLYMPMTPSTAQYLADNLDCVLPTKILVDNIYNKATIKLDPQPIPPSDNMTTVPVFKQHTFLIKQQISQIGFERSADNIIAGHKKDIIISNKIYSSDRNFDRVVIYGWHLSENNPIQPVYNGHDALYADYSHGVRLISNIVVLNGELIQIEEILNNPMLSTLLSDEGVIGKPYYPVSDIFSSIERELKNSQKIFILNQNYPNPFNQTTTINYQLSKVSEVDLSIFNSIGKKIATLVSAKQPEGNHKIEWNALSYASGIYFYKLNVDILKQSRKMILLK